MAWPKTVPILEPHHIHKGDYDGLNGTHCLAGWWQQAFAKREERWAAWKAIQCAVGSVDPTQFNDSRRRPKSTIARAWNRAMARLGYVVGNPEAKKLKSGK